MQYLPFPPHRYHKLNFHLKQTFGCRVQKIPVNAGFTCPNRDGKIDVNGCIYCDSKGASVGLGQRSLSVREQMLEGIENSLKIYQDIKFIAYFQAFSSTYAPVDFLDKVYKEAMESHPGVVGLSIGTRPDCLSDEILEMLSAYARRYYFWLELGLQSVHDETLSLINRGHNLEQFTQAVIRAHERGIKVCAHVILGLPGEDREKMLETARYINKMGIEGVKIHNLYILQDTALAKFYEQGKYSPLAMDEYLDLTCDFLQNLSPDVVVQRVASNPPAERLIAPKWAVQKRIVLRNLDQKMLKVDIWQGQKEKGSA